MTINAGMLGEDIKLSLTELGHYCVSIINKKQQNSHEGKDQVKFVLHLSDFSSIVYFT